MFSLSPPRPAYDRQWANHSISWNSTCTPSSKLVNTNSSSQIVEIVVGAAGQLAFNPNSVSVTPGTTLRFDFLGLNHTLTQSSSASLCHNSSGVDTGFQQFNPQNVSGTFLVDYLVESDRPQWFYCAQNEPISHCQSGMVFSVNPSDDRYERANETRSSGSPSSSAPPVTSRPMASLCTNVPLSASPNKTVSSDGTASLTFQPYPTIIAPDLSNNARRLTYALPLIAGLLFMAII
ncbi:extracellular serine-rich protein [Paraphaeosphaeria minitans]|uniref:Extracellular serine-rich protein n=1 Tax=Paraphaeosphaeria minitans TaxID=565426 RepID=A0A9P6GDR8_9PLEO|nr:extracellular serine-rich protein [Paraphaeosphaeria minitans]